MVKCVKVDDEKELPSLAKDLCMLRYKTEYPTTDSYVYLTYKIIKECMNLSMDFIKRLCRHWFNFCVENPKVKMNPVK